MTKDVFLPHNQKLAEATNFLIGERDENRPRNVGSEEITPLLWHFLMTTVPQWVRPWTIREIGQVINFDLK